MGGLLPNRVELFDTPAQLDMLVAHIWELGSTHFDYYYLTENCSYHILAMLEVADPKLELMKHLRWPVIPVDTVKALFRAKGLVRSVHFRPSNRTLFRARLDSLNDTERQLLGELTVDPNAQIPKAMSVASRIKTFDAALDYMDHALARELLTSNFEDEHKQRLLERRAALGGVSPKFEVIPDETSFPQRGHGTQRWGMSSGYSTSQGFFHQLDARLALHSLDDPSQGYPEHMQIEFLPTSVRYDIEQPRVTLEELSVVRILSLTPLDAFSAETSWNVRLGATRIRDDGCDECLAAVAIIGGGGALSFANDGVVAYLMLNTQLLGLGPIDGIEGLPLRAGLGPFGGLRFRWSARFVTLFEAEATWLPVQEPTVTWNAKATSRLLIGPDAALSVAAVAQPDAQSLSAGALLYF